MVPAEGAAPIDGGGAAPIDSDAVCTCITGAAAAAPNTGAAADAAHIGGAGIGADRHAAAIIGAGGAAMPLFAILGAGGPPLPPKAMPRLRGALPGAGALLSAAISSHMYIMPPPWSSKDASADPHPPHPLGSW
mmetsp:Transcript_124539/g.277888  ORF Transcript_124539/g.277888 Transcript_124539/m.277888 type:complete len:134 (+) Transcript_124539:700-1101(+)